MEATPSSRRREHRPEASCIHGIKRLSGRPLCLEPRRHRDDDCTSVDALDCLTSEEWTPVLKLLCQGKDWPLCMARLAKGELAENAGAADLGPHGRYVQELVPALCSQLSKEDCRTYGKGRRAVRCRWHSQGNERTGEPMCGALSARYDLPTTQPIGDCWRGGISEDCRHDWVREAGDLV